MGTPNVMIGIVIALVMMFILSFYYGYAEVKAFWWMYITMLAIVALFTKTQRLMECIAGALILDAILSAAFLLFRQKLFDAAFLLLHHIIWATAYIYLSGSGSMNTLKIALLGQLCISSLDVLMNMSILCPLPKKDLIAIGAKLNVYGRMILGNAAIACSGVSWWPIIIIFNSGIGLVLFCADDPTEYY